MWVLVTNQCVMQGTIVTMSPLKDCFNVERVDIFGVGTN